MDIFGCIDRLNSIWIMFQMPTVLEPVVRTVVGRLVPGVTSNSMAGARTLSGCQPGHETDPDRSLGDTEMQLMDSMKLGGPVQTQQSGSKMMQKTLASRFKGVLKAVSQVCKGKNGSASVLWHKTGGTGFSFPGSSSR